MVELEFVEEYTLPNGEKRFRFRVKGTSIYINVSASNPDEARQKALKLVKDIELDKVLREVAEKQRANL